MEISPVNYVEPKLDLRTIFLYVFKAYFTVFFSDIIIIFSAIKSEP